MKMNPTYAVVFNAQQIDSNNILLTPSNLIEGMEVTDTEMLDRYERSYNQICFSGNLNKYNNLYGLKIKEDKLVEFFASKGYPDDIVAFPEMCANIYFDMIKKFTFIVSKENGKKDCVFYAIRLSNKVISIIDMKKSFVEQLYKKDKQSDKSEQTKGNRANSNKYNPAKVLENVKKRVIGQDEAATTLVNTVCKNFKYKSFPGMKSNVLLFGPTGCGKTELTRTLENELGIPVITETVANYTATGYQGDSVKDILRRLYTKCNRNVKQAENSIIVLDEFDKLASNDSRDTINKKDVQEELLTMIEGAKIDINDGAGKGYPPIYIDTSNITFILCGAFTGLVKNQKKNSIGFGSIAEQKEEKIEITNEDLTSYGIIPEIVGRITTIIPIKKLEKNELKEVLEKSSISCLKVYEDALSKTDNVKVVYENREDFIDKVAIKAEKLGVGARGLKTVVDGIFETAVSKVNNTDNAELELVLSNEIVENPKAYVFKKVRRDKNELSERTGKANK